MKLAISFISSIAKIKPSLWDEVVASDNPFVKHGYLNGLEQSSCVCAKTGWKVSHLEAKNANLGDQTPDLVAVMPLYIKHHSYGENIFDWSWALCKLSIKRLAVVAE